MKQNNEKQNKIAELLSSYQESENPQFEKVLLEKVLREHEKFQNSKVNNFFNIVSTMKSFFSNPQAKVFAVLSLFILVPIIATFMYAMNMNTNTNTVIQNAEFSAQVNALQGELFTETSGGEKTQYVIGQKLIQGSVLKTGDAAYADIAFTNGSRVSLAPNTEVELLTVSKEQIAIKNITGELYANVVSSGFVFDVVVDDVTYRAHGTEFKVTKSASATSVIVYESEVSVIKQDTESVILQKGESYTIKIENGKDVEVKEAVDTTKEISDSLKQWSDAAKVTTPSVSAQVTVSPGSVTTTPTTAPTSVYQVSLLVNNSPNDSSFAIEAGGSKKFTISSDVHNSYGRPDTCTHYYVANGTRKDVYTNLTMDFSNEYTLSKGTYVFTIECTLGSTVVKDALTVSVIENSERTLIVSDSNAGAYNQITYNGAPHRSTETLEFGTKATIPVELKVNKVYSCNFSIYYDKAGTKVYLETKTVTQPQYSTSFTNSQGDGKYYVTSSCENQEGGEIYASGSTTITTKPQNLDAALIGTTHNIFLSSYNSVNPQAKFTGTIKVLDILTNVFINMKIVGNGTGFKPGQEYQIWICFSESTVGGSCSSHTGAKAVADAEGKLYFDTSTIGIGIHSGRWPRNVRIFENLTGMLPEQNCTIGNNFQACAAGYVNIPR